MSPKCIFCSATSRLSCVSVLCVFLWSDVANTSTSFPLDNRDKSEHIFEWVFHFIPKDKKRSLHSCYVRQAKVLLLASQTTAVVFYFLFSSSSLSSRCVVHAFFSLSISHMHLTVNIFPWLYSTYSVPIYTYMYVQLVVFIYAATAYLKHDLSLLECCLCECYCYSSSRSLMMWPKKLFASAHMIRIWYFHASKEKSMSVAEINSKGIYVNTNC